MSALSREVRASRALIGRNFNLVKRYAGWEVVFVFYNAVNALTIGLIGLAEPGPGQAYRVLYLAIGALLWNFLSVLFFEVSNSVSWERWEGTIEYSFMAPVRRVTYLLGVCGYAVIYGGVRTLIVLGALALFFHVNLSHADLPAALLILLASSLPFLGMGLLGAIMPLLSAERGAQATQILQGVILLVSGVYYPISVLPGWLRMFSVVSPATYTLLGRAQRGAERRVHRAPLAHGPWPRAVRGGADPARSLCIRACRALCTAHRQTQAKWLGSDRGTKTGDADTGVACL